MTTLGTLVKGHGLTVAPLPFDPSRIMLEITAAVGRANLTAGATPLDLGDGQAIIAAVTAWTFQDDDAHEPCSLVACRAPLHPGPCKGWKGTLHSVAPGTYKQIEEERVRKANERRVKRIADLRAQGKPIPRRLLTEIKPKPAPNAGVGGATATPLGKVNQQADLAGGQAHTASQAINQQAGVQQNTANLPKGPKGRKPTVAGRGPAFVITQPKVTDQYKLDKAAKLTAADWAALSPADKKAIRDELEAIKVRGFGPQQVKATALLAQLPAASTLGTSAAPNSPAAPQPNAPQAPSAAPGKKTLGQATKTVSRPGGGPGSPQDNATRHAASGGASAAAVLDAVDKVPPGTLDPTQKKVVAGRLAFIANHNATPAAQKQRARDLLNRIDPQGPPAPPPGPAAPAPAAVAPGKPTLPSPGPSVPAAPKPTLPSPGPAAPSGPATSASQADASLAVTEAIFGPQVTPPQSVVDMFDKLKAQGGDLKSNRNFRQLVDRLAQAALKKANAAKMPGLGHGANDIHIGTINKEIADHIADGKPGLPPIMAKLKAHLGAQKSAGSASAPAGPAAPQPNAPAVSTVTPGTPPAGAVPAPVAATKTPTLPSPGPTGVSGTPPTSAKAAPASSPSASPTPKAFPPHVQTARATAGRALGRPTSKAHLDAYGKLSKADFDSLDQATQRTIRDDLANASAKFLDPAKKQAARDLLDRFGSRQPAQAPAASPSVGNSNAPAAPNANPKGYSDPQTQAVKAATSGTVVTGDVLKSVARLTPKQVADLDGTDRKAVLGRLAFIATHPKASDGEKAQAAAYGRIVNGGTYVPTSKKWDHEPSIGELAREEQTGGHAAIFAAEVAARDTTMDADARLKALTALTKAQFDTLTPDVQRQITDSLHEMHRSRIHTARDPGVDAAVEKAFATYVGMHPALHRLGQAEADFRAGRIDASKLYSAVLSARIQAPSATGSTVRDELEREIGRVARDNPALPAWARSSMIRNVYGAAGGTYSAISMASMEHNWEKAPRLSQSDITSIFAPTVADLANVDPIHADAVKALRLHLIETGLRGDPGVPTGSPWSLATRNHVVDNLLHISSTSPEIPAFRLAEFNALPDGAKALVRKVLRERLASQSSDHGKTATWIALRELEGNPPLAGDVRDAVLKAASSSSFGNVQDVYRRLAPSDYASLPDHVRGAIQTQLGTVQARLAASGPAHVWSPADNALRVLPAALASHLIGARPAIVDRNVRNAFDIANYGRDIVTPNSRVAAYSRLTPLQVQGLPQSARTALFDDLTKIENDGAVPVQTRYDAAMNNHIFLPMPTAVRLSDPQMNAAQAADLNPVTVHTDTDAARAFHRITKADYDGLPKAIRDGIDARIAQLPATDQQALTAKFHPAAVSNLPSGTVPTGAQAPVPAHVQDALDVLYGVNPKAHTMAAQLSAYGGLRGSDFNAFNVQEQQQLLSDLSFIATTAKGPSADKARKLIDRFTPPGTPAGQTPANPAVVPPANSVPGQVRYATPQVGTLVMAKDKGRGGDGWVSTPGGKRVWGKYGAAGLLLRHVDPNTGEKRYLMVQRGPGISDPGKWQFPGGAIDEKETFHQGGAREVIEELGFKPDDLKSAGVVGEHTSAIPGSTWKYVSIAADVPSMLKPDLSSHHAQLETSDAKWMTEAEIRALDTSGKLLAPLAGGKLEQNVMSLFPAGTGKLGQVARPGPVTKRLGRLVMPAGGRQAPSTFNAWTKPHKPSTGRNLVADKAAIDAQRQKIKKDAPLYDGKTADGRLAAIGAQQGFDATPTVLDKKEIDRLLATGDYIEAWRGVRGSYGSKSAAQINEEMRTGPAYYGKGIFGNGYYLATQKRVAEIYSDHTRGSLVRILIPKSAVIEKYDKVEREAQANSSRYSKNTSKSAYADPYSTFWDPGRWGAAKGLDGIEINPGMRAHGGGGSGHVAAPGKPAFNWLNRSVLILQKEPG